MTGLSMAPRLSPYPDGWFAVAFASELARRGVMRRQFMGRELVLFRTESSVACAVDAHCPHLGAHLGEGGTVCGETIRCPFHGFRFDGSGRCVATGYGTRPPPQARIRSWPLREKQGLLLVHHDHLGRPPAWEVPDLDEAGWTSPRSRAYVLRGHPQETTENGVDSGHFAMVHGFREATARAPLTVDGPHLFVGYRMVFRGLRADFDITVHGLGYSVVETRFPGLALRMRQLILAAPLDGERIALRITLSVARVGTGTLPERLGRGLARAIAAPAMWLFAGDVSRDFRIWEHKVHQARPLLARGDGPIGEYRRWARQFYDSTVV